MTGSGPKATPGNSMILSRSVERIANRILRGLILNRINMGALETRLRTEELGHVLISQQLQPLPTTTYKSYVAEHWSGCLHLYSFSPDNLLSFSGLFGVTSRHVGWRAFKYGHQLANQCDHAAWVDTRSYNKLNFYCLFVFIYY